MRGKSLYRSRMSPTTVIPDGCARRWIGGLTPHQFAHPTPPCAAKVWSAFTGVIHECRRKLCPKPACQWRRATGGQSGAGGERTDAAKVYRADGRMHGGDACAAIVAAGATACAGGAGGRLSQPSSAQAGPDCSRRKWKSSGKRN